ncbi:MAG: hypothetical protein K2Z80_28015 [Xanthobacteraceae bacterium]|nr:hypothetical protein [Xanthobacteraceae bacterium]
MPKPATNGAASEATRPFTLRLAARDIEQLQARAHIVSGTVTAVARELIVTALAGGDSRTMAERLMQIERRLAAIEGSAREIAVTAERTEAVVAELCVKFDALLTALCAGGTAS